MIEAYGLTEAVTGISCNPLYGQRKLGTVGIPFTDVEWRVVDPIDGEKVLPAGQPGEIVLRCPELMMGYLNQPQKTAIAGPTMGPVPAMLVKWWPKMTSLRVGT